LEKTGNNGVREKIVIDKKVLSEVVFDSGDKLNLSLSEYPPSASASAAKPDVSSPARTKDAIGAASSATLPAAQAHAPKLGSPFVYGGFSAVVPGLGQFILGEKGKGAICFGVVGVSFLGAMLAWNSTTDAYNKLQKNKSAGGVYRDADYRAFTFRLHGAELITGISAILYLLNIADATAEGFVFSKKISTIKPMLTTSSTGAGCAFSMDF
jgi:hypothetical protein